MCTPIVVGNQETQTEFPSQIAEAFKAATEQLELLVISKIDEQEELTFKHIDRKSVQKSPRKNDHPNQEWHSVLFFDTVEDSVPLQATKVSLCPPLRTQTAEDDTTGCETFI